MADNVDTRALYRMFEKEFPSFMYKLYGEIKEKTSTSSYN